MSNGLCLNCFEVKGDFQVCPKCGYAEGTPPEQPHFLVPGTTLKNGRFIVGTSIGSGGFGITYKCYDTTLGIIVAAKEFYPVGMVNRAAGQKHVGLLSKEKKDQYRAQMHRFLKEARSIAKFGMAKDIVNVYDYFEENNTAYMIMEFIDGILLKDYLEEEGKLEPGVALTIIERIIEAVKKIHSQGIIHRDISPDNIFIDDKNSIKVFDFGAAVFRGDDDTQTADKIIKVGYSAPEQYRDNKKQGFYTDIYSIGAIFYHMLTGVKPIESTEREVKDTLQSPRKLGVDIPENLDRTIMQAMAVRPELRFQSVAQLEDAVNDKLLAQYPEVTVRRRKRRKNIIAFSSVAVIIAIIVGVLLVITNYNKKNEIFEHAAADNAETINVLVDSETQKKVLETYAKDALEEDATSDDSDSAKIMKNDSKKLTFNIVNIKNEKYKDKEGGNRQYKSMDEVLKETRGSKYFPDIFISDNVTDLDSYDLVSYKDNICELFDANVLADRLYLAKENYLFFSDYDRYFPKKNEMPTSFDVMLVYALGEKNSILSDEKDGRKNKKKNKLEKVGLYQSSLIDNYRSGMTVELSDLVSMNNDGKEYTFIPKEYLNTVNIMYKSNGDTGSDGKLKVNEDKTPDIFGNMSSEAESKRKWNMDELGRSEDGESGEDKKNSGETLAGTSIIAGTGFKSSLSEVHVPEVTKDDGDSLPYTVYPVVSNGKMLVKMTGKLAISADNSNSIKTACERFVYCAMSQGYSAVDQDETVPISLSEDNEKNAVKEETPDNAPKEENRDTGFENTVFSHYFDLNTKFKVIEDLIEKRYPCMIEK